MTHRLARWLPAALVLVGLALLVAFILRGVLDPANVRLPGRDAGNVYVWEVYNRSVFSTGRIPHWNPYHFAGTPHLADTLTTTLYPPAMLLRWLPLPLFFGWMAAVHLWIAGAGMLLLGRVVGLRWPAAAAAGVAVTLGGSVGAWLYNGHLLLIYCTAWLPLALALAVLSVRRDRLMPHPALVAVLVLQFLAGYLQGSIYVTAAVCLYFAYSILFPDPASRTKRWRPLAQLAVLGVLALGVSAFQLLPTARLVAEAGRTSGLTYEMAAEDAWSVGDLASLFLPFRGVEAEPPHRYIGDQVVYVGWMLAGLLPFAFFDVPRRRVVMFFTVLGASAIALALADAVPLFRLHHALFPGLRGPGRVLFVATVSLAILGAIGLQRFIEVASARQRVPVMRGAAVTAIVIATAALALVPYVSGSGPAPSHLWPWLPLIAACGVLCAGWLAARKGPRAALVVALCFVAVDVSAFAFGSVETYPVETVQELRKWLGPPDTGRAVSFCEHRVNAGGMLLNTQASVDGMAGVHLGDYADWAYVAKFGDPVPHDGIVRRIGSEGQLAARRDLLDVANVTTFLACEPLEAPALKLVSYSDGLYRYRNLSAWPRAVWTCDAEEMSRAEAVRTILDGRYDEHGRLVRRRYINVRWWPWVPPERRRDVELRHGLLEGVAQHGMTWRYVYDNPSAPNGLALIRDPAVEDTEGLDRATGALVDRPSRATADVAGPTELLVGTKDCASRANVKMLVHDQPDGRVSLRVDAPVPGIVFLSEPYYPERQAFVDGKPVTPVKANLAFTAVPVLPGPHRVELRHVPSSFHLGLGISAFTLVAWAGLLVRR